MGLKIQFGINCTNTSFIMWFVWKETMEWDNIFDM